MQKIEDQCTRLSDLVSFLCNTSTKKDNELQLQEMVKLAKEAVGAEVAMLHVAKGRVPKEGEPTEKESSPKPRMFSSVSTVSPVPKAVSLLAGANRREATALAELVMRMKERSRSRRSMRSRRPALVCTSPLVWMCETPPVN